MFTKTADATNQPIDQSNPSAEPAVKGAQNLANGAMNGLQEAMHDMRLQAAPLIDRVLDSSHQLRVKATHASEDTVNYIRDEPVKAMLIAAATGAALMALISLFSAHRNHH